MTEDHILLRSKEELLAGLEDKTAEEREFTTRMVEARERFDDTVDNLISDMMREAQPDEAAFMSEEAYAVAEGIKQGLSGHLGKMIAVVGTGTKGEVEGENALGPMTAQALHAVVATVKVTADQLAAMAVQRKPENDNG